MTASPDGRFVLAMRTCPRHLEHHDAIGHRVGIGMIVEYEDAGWIYRGKVLDIVEGGLLHVAPGRSGVTERLPPWRVRVVAE